MLNQKLTKRFIKVAAIAATAALTLSSCSSKAETNTSDESGVKVGAGINGNVITLGILADQTGPFAGLSGEVVASQEIYWRNVNEAGGICGVYDVKLDVRDMAYNVQQTVAQYDASSPNVLLYSFVVGASPTLAIIDQAAEDSIVVTQHAGVSTLMSKPAALTTGASYDVVAQNMLAWAVESGLAEQGAKAGLIYMEGDFGQSTLEGYQEIASQHDITLIERLVKPTDTDMSGQVGEFVDAGVDFIILSTGPIPTASVAALLESRGLSMPIITTYPGFTQSLLDSDVSGYLVENLYVGQIAASFDTEAGKSVLESYLADNPGDSPSVEIVAGYGDAVAAHALLEQACEAGDLTREGVFAMKQELTEIDVHGAYPTLHYDASTTTATEEIYVTKASKVPGGLDLVVGPYRSPDLNID